MKMTASSLCWQLGIGDPRYIEIESKWRVSPEESKKLLDHLDEMKGVKHEKRVTFFDQYLDTAGLDLLGLGASLRLRYRKNGSQVYLQYKGPGFRRSGLLYRSEFSSNRLVKLVREESHHDIVRFTHTSVREILQLENIILGDGFCLPVELTSDGVTFFRKRGDPLGWIFC
jgi:uncharacterized protein YjbK